MIRFILRPRSAWATPLRADTLYGLLLMRMGEEEGPQAVQDALDVFRQGNSPFVLSSAMPAHTVPAPCLPSMPRALFQRKVQEGAFVDAQGKKLSLLQALQAYKSFRKQAYIPLQMWIKHAYALSSEALFKDFCAQESKQGTDFSFTATEPHVTLDRTSGSALQGGLFQNSLTYYGEDSIFHMYAKVTNTQQAEQLLYKLQRIGLLGFGKDASTGKGRFDVELDTDFMAEMLVPKRPAQSEFLLSPCASDNMQGVQGYYATEIKRGKVSWHISQGNPFKSPFICLREGAVLSSLPQGSFVLDAVHTHSHVAQVLVPLTLPCAVSEAAYEC